MKEWAGSSAAKEKVETIMDERVKQVIAESFFIVVFHFDSVVKNVNKHRRQVSWLSVRTAANPFPRQYLSIFAQWFSSYLLM
jgi:hypothetical protein